MQEQVFKNFLNSNDTLRIYEGDLLIFSSNKNRLLPLMEYIELFASSHQKITVYDKITGNAAALLSIKAGCQEVGSPLSSEITAKTLDKYGIKSQFNEIIPFIKKDGSEEMCPMEKLSLDKDPESFYQAMKEIIG